MENEEIKVEEKIEVEEVKEEKKSKKVNLDLVTKSIGLVTGVIALGVTAYTGVKGCKKAKVDLETSRLGNQLAQKLLDDGLDINLFNKD